MKIPFLDLPAQHRELKTEILSFWEEILDAAAFVGGTHVQDFERAFADACRVSEAVTVGSGTDALRFIFISLGLSPGDEVITVPNTFIATSEAITQAGGKPVFVDIEPGTWTLDPVRIEAAVTERTRGIVPVHLYGQTADMDPILETAQKHGLWVVEDACQAHLATYKGRTAGSMGIAAAFSFYPGKNLGACGEAGAVTTGSAELAARVRMLRDHGQSQKYHHETEGYNGRCDALQAAALKVKLRYLEKWSEARRAHAGLYNRLLADNDCVTLPVVRPGCVPVYHLYVIQVDDRDRVRDILEKKGIATGLHYPVPLHLQKAYSAMGFSGGSFPVAESCARRMISLPMYPELTEFQISEVVRALGEATASVK